MASSRHLPTLARYHLVWGRLSDVVLFPSCLVRHGFTDAPLLIEHRFQATRVTRFALQFD